MCFYNVLDTGAYNAMIFNSISAGDFDGCN